MKTTTTTVIDAGGCERHVQIAGTHDVVQLYRELGTGVVGDNADGVRLYESLEAYLNALPESDRAEVAAIFNA